MSTLAIILIVVAAIVVLLILLAAARRAQSTRMVPNPKGRSHNPGNRTIVAAMRPAA